MSDLITRAREQWCQLEYVRETVHGEQVTGYYSCPPEVVAALLDVLKEARTVHGGRSGDSECNECGAVDAAEAAIAKALEEK